LRCCAVPVRRNAKCHLDVSMHVASNGILSSPVWVPLGVFVALLVGVPVIWLTWRLVFARMRLSYSVLQTPLMVRSEFGSQLRVIYGEGDRERQLGQARVVRLRLTSRSVKDIPTAAFDDGAPLIVDLGTPVLAILGGEEPSQSSGLPITDDGDRVRIAPRLIKKGQIITINVLVDGIPHIRIVSPLIDVRVSEKTPTWFAKLGQRLTGADLENTSDSGQWVVIIAALVGAAAVIVAALIGFIWPSNSITIVPGPTVTVTVATSAKPSP
jgi:hypothetical protein